jgi:hypothetical protein
MFDEDNRDTPFDRYLLDEAELELPDHHLGNGLPARACAVDERSSQPLERPVLRMTGFGRAALEALRGGRS